MLSVKNMFYCFKFAISFFGKNYGFFPYSKKATVNMEKRIKIKENPYTRLTNYEKNAMIIAWKI